MGTYSRQHRMRINPWWILYINNYQLIASDVWEMFMSEQELDQLAELIASKLSNPKMTLTTDEVAEQLNTTRSYVSELRNRKKLRAFKIGKRYIYPRKEVERYIERECGR